MKQSVTDKSIREIDLIKINAMEIIYNLQMVSSNQNLR